MMQPPSHRLADWRHCLLIALAALIAILPLMHQGPSCGHDFDFHLLSWMEAARQFAHGNFHPHWAYTPAFNAGEPRFVFYPPISWSLGAVLGLLLTHLPGVSEGSAWTGAPILFSWIALALCGLTMYRLARSFVSANAALLAATIYLANPYMLFTAYERTAYAELLAAAWIPLLLHGILRRRVTIPGIAVPLALLWLTNAPAAVMGSYTLALLATIRIVLKPNLSVAVKTVVGTALGFALAAFYIVPAAWERRFVQIAMATISGMRIDQNFLFEHTGATTDAMLHDQVLHTASAIAVVLLMTTAGALAALAMMRKRADIVSKSEGMEREESMLMRTAGSFLPTSFPLLPLAILTVGIGFALTRPSLFFWSHAPQLMFLQFPWRLLAILAPVAALSIAAILNRLPLKPAPVAGVALLLAMALTHPAYRIFHQPCDREDTATARLALFHSSEGTDPTDEYTPATADNDSLKARNPPYWLSSTADAPAPISTNPGAAPTRLSLTVPQAEDLILNLRDYPNWRISLNGSPAPAHIPRADGLIAFRVPAGSSTVDVRYSQTIDQTAGEAITLIAVGCLLFTFRRRRPSPLPQRIAES